MKSKLEHRRAHSDLASNASGLFGLLGILAWCERQLLRFISLHFGLSVLVIALIFRAPSFIPCSEHRPEGENSAGSSAIALITTASAVNAR
jgi:hypothetical protein